MENLFLYGVSGADLDDCDSFLHRLQHQTNPHESQDPATGTGVYIPSPQGMLNTGIDPYAPQDNFDQLFVIDQNQWDYPDQPQQPAQPAYEAASPNTSWTSHSIHSPPIKAESDSSSPQDDETYLPDSKEIGVETSGIAKRGSARQRKTKTSHNMIEKRYRNNINDKINMLRDSVPTLREAASSPLVDGIPSIRLNKATVLTKAAEYIEQLKTRNKMLQKENSELRARVSGPRPPIQHHQQQPQPPQTPQPPHQQHHNIMSQHSVPPSSGQVPPQHPQSAPNPQDFYRNHNSQQSSGRALHPHQPQQSHGRSVNTNLALGCATAGLLTTGSVLSSGDGSFRGLSALPFPAIYNLLGRPSASSLKLTAVAAVCFSIGCIYISLLSNWSSRLSAKNALAARGGAGSSPAEGDVRTDAMARLGLPLRPSFVYTVSNICILAPQALFCLVFGISSYEYLRTQIGLPYVSQLGYYLDKVIELDLTGQGRECVLETISTFLMSFTSYTPRRKMLQAVQLKHLAAKIHMTTILTPLIDRMWMRGGQDLPEYLQNLAKVPLSKISDGNHTHINIGASGVKYSTFWLNAYEDSNPIGLLELIACRYSYNLQDQFILALINNEEPDLELLEKSATISPTDATSHSRWLILKAILAKDVSELDAAISQINLDSKTRHLHPLLPRGVTCALAMWYSKRPETGAYAETLCSEALVPLKNFRSAAIFCAFYLALKMLYKKGLGRSDLIGPALEIRAWLGSADAAAFGLSDARRKELIEETLQFVKGFASREIDEACSIPDDLVEAAFME